MKVGWKAKIMRAGSGIFREQRSSLIWRFFLIGVAALAPLSAALVQFAGDERKLAMEATRERAEVLISYAVERQSRMLEDTRVLLHHLSDTGSLNDDEQGCKNALQRHFGIYPWLISLRVSEPGGREICTASSENSNSTFSEQEVFRKTLSGERFALGELTADSKSGLLSMAAAMPILDKGQVEAIITAVIRLDLQKEHSFLALGTSLDINTLVLDRNGTLIAHDPPMPGWIGRSLQSHEVARSALEKPQGYAEAADLFGSSRLFVFRALPGTDTILAVGLNRASVIGAIDETLRYRFFLIIIIVSGSLLLGMLGVEGLILRPLRSLVQTAEALERGNFDVRSPYKGMGEVRILERAFNRMAQAVADREKELMASKDVAEKALSQANIASQAKTNFLASMSHEIRTPLNGIIGYTEQLLDEKLNTKQRRYADLIQVSASALLTVANDILDFSSIEAEQIRLQIEPFSLMSLIDNTVSIVSSGAGKKGVPIRIEWDPEVPKMVLGDEARLRQILLNLLNNAVKFTREGQITTRVECKGASDAGEIIRISVTDTGIGIPLEQHGRLFKRFSQGDPSIRREFGGTGLGLAISKRLIELMGGQIGMQSEQGKGSTFWIELSLPQIDMPPLVPIQEGVPKATKPARILIVEDVEINRELVQILLEAAGHTIDAACNGEEAVAAVQASNYDLVLMDIQMPGMDGMTAIREIRALDHPASKVFIAAMTANVLPQQVRDFMKAGFNDHIGKPVRRDDLMRKLKEWLPDIVDASAESDAGPSSQTFKKSHFADFRNTIGAERISQWLARLDEQLRTSLASDDFVDADRRYIARAAHAITSQAALLGFSELAEFCTALEQECGSGGDISTTLGKARQAARMARDVIAEMNSLSLA
ncbi:hybrid sensor histidine kinase/response regulator [Microvirga solisilvae]|uniref:hybrid sensor histidine kinase/response regulator n=1 Tax=Microvirga solisilvae TaxID=2919498 RepID=UPI001FAF2CFF|nr:hybrid sensor histidine kinase/response regulator [Microvirga solisilvae]